MRKVILKYTLAILVLLTVFLLTQAYFHQPYPIQQNHNEKIILDDEESIENLSKSIQ